MRIYDFPVNTAWLTMEEGHVLFDSRLGKIADKSEETGFRKIKYSDLTLSIQVKRRQLVFIVTEPDFDPVMHIIRK